MTTFSWLPNINNTTFGNSKFCWECALLASVMSLILLVLNELCNILFCTVKTNRPLDQVSLEIHPFRLSQVDPEIREKWFYTWLSLHMSSGPELFYTYRFSWISWWPRRSHASFFSLEISCHPVKLVLFLVSCSVTELFFFSHKDCL